MLKVMSSVILFIIIWWSLVIMFPITMMNIFMGILFFASMVLLYYGVEDYFTKKFK